MKTAGVRAAAAPAFIIEGFCDELEIGNHPQPSSSSLRRTVVPPGFSEPTKTRFAGSDRRRILPPEIATSQEGRGLQPAPGGD